MALRFRGLDVDLHPGKERSGLGAFIGDLLAGTAFRAHPYGAMVIGSAMLWGVAILFFGMADSIVLALASAGRYYFVITIGERIVAELRKDVFRHVIGLSPSFYDRTLSGEIVSRLTADTVQIKSAVGDTASLALRSGSGARSRRKPRRISGVRRSCAIAAIIIVRSST